MDKERFQKLKRLFDDANGLPAEEREAFLKKECGGDSELRAEVEKRLNAFDEADTSFLEGSAVIEVVSMFDEKKTLSANQTTGEMQNVGFVAGTILDNRYRIIGLLGKGGMGEVYKAEDLKLDQTVALKFLPDKLEKNEDALKRFIGEVKTARRVAHQNVCKVFDIGDVNGKHYLSMEFIDGDDLSQLLRRIGRLPSDKAAEISRQICFGLYAIHEAGILHRDLKPANIIIDSNGKARITDFGIAGFEQDVQGAESRVGTPAYMSPEQITGKEVTTKSDIYSLGLLLYEIFTGKQAFRADSIDDLIRKHESETPTDPSTFVENINPLVEKIINRCLEKDPDDRPASAVQVALTLPGGNPLEAAMAAGETPSPEMVAASPKKGALKPRIAAACVLGALMMLVFCMFAAMNIAPQNRIPFNKSPEVLSERANEIVARLGYTDTPADTNYRFDYVDSYLNYARQNPSLENWNRISSGQPLIVVFVERQSPRYFDVLAKGDGDWLIEPQTASGMRTILLDTRARLVKFSAVPPQFTSENQNVSIDWSPAFSAAELDLAKFREIEPNWTPPAAFDTRMAWGGVLPDHTEIPLRVEAASFQGKIVFFELIYPWTKPDAEAADNTTTRDWVGIFILAGIGIGIIIAGIFLARKHIKSGSGDRKGAFKILLFVLGLSFCGGFLGMNHVPSVAPELARFSHALRLGLFAAAFTWLMYLALEPYIRRNLPELIVSWNRLLAGDWRDPLVGRDVLFGTLFGIAHFTFIYAGKTAERYFNEDLAILGFPVHESLSSLRFSAAAIVNNFGLGIVGGFMPICALVILYLLLRRRLYAEISIFTLLATVEILFFTHSLVYLPFTLAISIMMTLVISRFGLVANVMTGIVFASMRQTLFTLSFSTWYASSMFLTLFLIVALLAYGFKISLANQPLFGDKLAIE